eukprot:4532135-Prorocentrum_lima.AAC.1
MPPIGLQAFADDVKLYGNSMCAVETMWHLAATALRNVGGDFSAEKGQWFTTDTTNTLTRTPDLLIPR